MPRLCRLWLSNQTLKKGVPQLNLVHTLGRFWQLIKSCHFHRRAPRATFRPSPLTFFNTTRKAQDEIKTARQITCLAADRLPSLYLVNSTERQLLICENLRYFS